MKSAVYNARKNLMSPPTPLRAAVSVCFLSFSVMVARASERDAAEIQLVQKIAALAGSAAVRLETVNRSSLDARTVELVKRELISQLNSAGVRVVEPGNSAVVRVTLSESAGSFVWVAEVQQGVDPPRVVMTSFARRVSVGGDSSSALVIRRSWMWSQSEPMLDAAVVEENGTPSRLFVLGREAVVVYGLQQGSWRAEQTLSIPHAKPWPRDLRGRIILRRDHLFDVFLPGVSCTSSAKPPLSLSCREADEPWPLTAQESGPRAFYATDRNFFTGTVIPPLSGPGAQKFFSAVPVARDKYTLWLLAGTDGRLHFLDGVRDQAVSGTGWGSLILGLQGTCGGDLVLASHEGDASEHDYVRAFLVEDRELLPLSGPLEFEGALTALWPGADGKTATAVSRNRQTGNYEAYRLAIGCN